MLGEAFGAIPALQQESFAEGHAPQRLLEVPRLAGKDQRRKGRELLLDRGERLRIRIVRHLGGRLLAPAVGRPPFRHHNLRTLETRAIPEGNGAPTQAWRMIFPANRYPARIRSGPGFFAIML